MGLRKKKKRIDNRKRCDWADVSAGRGCGSPVYHTDPMTGDKFCMQHYHRFYMNGERLQMETERSSLRLDQSVASVSKKKVAEELPKEVARPAVVHALEMAEKLEKGEVVESPVANSAFKIRTTNTVVKGNTSLKNLGPGDRATFRSIDVNYYTQDFVDDYVVLLNQKLRRQHAICNILMEQLLRLEEEEEVLKLIETYGEQMVEGVPVKFSNIQKRHSTPFELKMRLLETWQKHEKEYRELLKQRNDTLVNALMILKRYGLKFDQKAAMIVVEVMQRQDQFNLNNSLLSSQTVTVEAEEKALIASVHEDVLSGFQRAGTEPKTLAADVDETAMLFEKVTSSIMEGNVEDDDW